MTTMATHRGLMAGSSAASAPAPTKRGTRNRGMTQRPPARVFASLLLLALVLTPLVPASANALNPVPFIEHASIPIADSSFAAWGDYDSDGDLDLVAGCTTSGGAHVYENEPTGVLTEVQLVPCGRSVLSSSDPWADYDGDGDLDLALPGRGASYMYRNDGGTFVADIRTSLPVQSSGGAWFQWGDLDNDDDPDLVILGVNHSRLLLNDGTGLLTATSHPFPTRDNHDADLGDYNNDGYLDLVTVGSGGSTAGGRFALLIYRNDGNSAGATPTFTRLGGELADRAGEVQWVDYDQDGLLDIFVAGGHDGFSYMEFWTQGPMGSFTQTVPAAFASYAALGLKTPGGGFSDWGDYDGDGDADLIISNNTFGQGCLTNTYRNEPTGTMVEDDTTGLHDVAACYFYPGWGDFDDDPGMELVTTDFFTSLSFLRVFKRNAPPTADAGGPYLVAASTDLALDGSGSDDPDGDTLTETWTADGGTVVETIYTAGAEPGVYDVCLTVNDGTVDSDESCTLVVVYDPSAGFATGGGWFIPGGNSSDPGDLLPGLDGESKANFGFVVKYKNGASTVPGGNLEFHYNVGDFHLRSSGMEWLVVTNSNWAKFQGTASIDGLEGDYPFRVDARDANEDRFVIKVYAPGANTAIDDAIYKASGDLGGGQIKIHG